MNKKKRILFGAVDIGYRIELYSKFIQKNLSDKLTAESFSKYVLPETHYKTRYTYTCPINKKSSLFLYLYTFCFFIFSLFRYNIFHFLSGETILTRKLRRFELFTYKLLGKKVIMHFVGADIRSPKYLDWKNENLIEFLEGQKGIKLTEPHQDKLIADARKYADFIIVSTPDLLQIIPEAIYFPVMLDLDQLPTAKKKDKLKILFSPSSHRTKGIKHIKSILEKVKSKYKDKIEINSPDPKSESHSYPLTRYQILDQMNESAIVIDQMLIGWYGLKTVEALACGCKVLCYIDDELIEHMFPDSPIIVSDVRNLQSNIEQCIEEILYEKEPTKINIDWVKKYHTIESNHHTLIKVWLS